ncbi:MAG: PadR family transcriptional regulator [Nocardioides sp.]|uniref:PadR family transcriptional regulator n=1 Tax=Nocardioides sp. TaxID=35761 RepID=UPI0039E6D7D2
MRSERFDNDNRRNRRGTNKLRHHPGGGPRGEWDFRGMGPLGRRGPGGAGPRGFGPDGPPPWLAGLFGFEGDERRRGPRVRRGDVRSAILGVLSEAKKADQPINGYQVIQQIAERSHGVWRPSPGSVYPTIQQLQDEGLVAADEGHGRRAITLTETGVEYAATHAADLEAVWRPFEAVTAQSRREAASGLRGEVTQVLPAVWQIATTGTEAQRKAAGDILAETRRKLYGILAEGPDGSAESGDTSEATDE